MSRRLHTFAEFAAAFLGLAVFVIVLVAWRLSDSPINSTFLTPYIESGLERYIPGAQAQIAHTLLTWDNTDHSLTLHADGVVITNAEQKVIGEVPMLDIRLSLLGLLVGQFWPIEMTIDHPQIKLNRHADGKLYFAAMTAQDNNTETNDNSREALRNALRNLTHAYAMRHLTIMRAAVAVHDEATNRDWSVSVPEVSLQRTLAQLVGTAKIDLTQKDQIATLELHYTYDPLHALHRVGTRFQDITPAQLAGGHPEALGLGIATMFDLPLSGETELAFDPELTIAAAAATLHGGAGVLHAPALWDKPRSLAGLDIGGDFDRRAQKINLTTVNIDFGGPRLALTAAAHAAAQPEKHDMDFTLKANLQNWPMDAFEDLWPKPVIPNARDWMMHHLAKGIYEAGHGEFNGSFSWDDLANPEVTGGKGTVTAAHGVVSYIDGMPPVQDVHAEAIFDLQQMSLALNNGSIGALRIQPFTAVISGLDANDQFIDLPMKITGPIPDVIRLIDHPPLRYASRVGLSDDLLSGTATGTVHLHFPLLKSLETKQIDVSVAANLENVASSKLIKGLDLSQGQLTLDLTPDSLSVKGPVALNKIPVRMALRQFFAVADNQPMRQLDVVGDIKNDQWKLLGDSFAGTNGTASVNVQLTETARNRISFSGAVDLTPTDLHFAPLSWKKPANVAAQIQVKGDGAEGKDITLRSITLRGVQANAEGKGVVAADGTIKALSFEPFRLGRTAADLYFAQDEGPNGSLHFMAHGKSLDISGLKSGKDPARSDPRLKEYRLNVDKLYTGENSVILQAAGYAARDAEGWSAISLRGLAEGEHKLAIDLTPQDNGTRRFSVTCNDFGKMLKSLGVTDTVKEGDVKITGISTREKPRTLQGKVHIGSFTVGKLPVLALLLNATSPFGFSGLVTDSASFEHMDGTFSWSGDEIELQSMNAAGSSMGINVAGKVDMNSGRANLHGTLVPFSMVNRILGSIPLLGDLLTGGDGGGVLAVSYDIKGSLAQPDVDVHPVSLLTPGFLRNLFFSSDSEDIEPEAETDAPAQDSH